MRKILLVFAHPDDETFSSSGTVAKYVKAGWQADLVCATLGEAGLRGDYEDTTEALGDIRKRELEQAGTLIGLSSITFLGYKDGTLYDLQWGDLEDKVYKEMVKIYPDVVITFEPTGGISNHPDHKRISQAATYAFQKYAKLVEKSKPAVVGETKRRESLSEASLRENEPKLYYACIPEVVVEYLQKKHILPSTMFGEPWRGIPDKFITTVIDIRRFRAKKIKALRTHASQSSDVNRFLSYKSNPLTLQEHFILRMQGTNEVFMGKKDRVGDRL